MEKRLHPHLRPQCFRWVKSLSAAVEANLSPNNTLTAGQADFRKHTLHDTCEGRCGSADVWARHTAWTERKEVVLKRFVSGHVCFFMPMNAPWAPQVVVQLKLYLYVIRLTKGQIKEVWNKAVDINQQWITSCWSAALFEESQYKHGFWRNSLSHPHKYTYSGWMPPNCIM